MTDSPPLDPQPVPAHATPWSFVRRVLFRFSAVYFVLYALPFPLPNLLSLCRSVFTVYREVQPPKTDPVPYPGWLTQAQLWLNEYSELWKSTTSKVHELGYTSIEVIHQRTGSGDTGHDFVKFVICLLAAGVLAMLWTGFWALFDRRRNHACLAKWLHLGVRWYLGFFLLSYGLLKIYSTQFGDPSLSRLMQPLGDYSPMGFVWTFMGHSEPYEFFSGCGETLGGLLLFWRRSSLLGCLVTIPVMTNVCLLNWMYDVPVKLFSSHLLVFTAALLIPDIPRLWALFVTNRPMPPADLRLVRPAFLRVPLMIFGGLWIAFHLAGNHIQMVQLREMRETRMGVKPELYGVWMVDKMIRDGAEVEPTDPTRWKFLAIDQRNRAWYRTLTDRTYSIYFEEDLDTNAATVRPQSARTPPQGNGEAGAIPAEHTWSVERGKGMREVQNPAPKSMADYRKPIDVEHDTLVLKGSLNGKAYELHLHRKQFRLLRGFHMVQELPYNR